ncbi:hypothetical protein KCP74_25565 (plasmid) [Salmonella enterica subsp. enterica]|nr:hypothetical protein KCP74_25565 [Salmonella enterica subsp. enterica]
MTYPERQLFSGSLSVHRRALRPVFRLQSTNIIQCSGLRATGKHRRHQDGGPQYLINSMGCTSKDSISSQVQSG